MKVLLTFGMPCLLTAACKRSAKLHDCIHFLKKSINDGLMEGHKGRGPKNSGKRDVEKEMEVADVK